MTQAKAGLLQREAVSFYNLQQLIVAYAFSFRLVVYIQQANLHAFHINIRHNSYNTCAATLSLAFGSYFHTHLA